MTLPRRLLPSMLVLIVFASTAGAHVLDEYLQAMLVSIEPGEIRLQINLTIGVEVADKVLPSIDRDGDGVISPQEQAAYAQQFERDLVARLDRHELELNLISSRFPDVVDLRGGVGIIQLELSAPPGALTSGPHALSVENRHFPAIGAYLFNAANPNSADIQITQQKRNINQSDGEIVFTYRPSTKSSNVVGITALLAVLAVIVVAAVWNPKRIRPFT